MFTSGLHSSVQNSSPVRRTGELLRKLIQLSCEELAVKPGEDQQHRHDEASKEVNP
jgi:hypothetical protein